jgi:hypothetical protein
MAEEGSNGSFWPHFLHALGRKKPSVDPDDPGDDGAADLYLGLWELKTGRADQAGVRFGRAGQSKEVGALSTALEGIAHLLKAPQAPGLIAGLQVLKVALGCLQGSRRKTADQDMDLLAAYFRGIGLAVLPDLFDTHREAARELTQVVRTAETTERGLVGMFHKELGLKASYFLASMYMEDEAYEHAERVLADLLKSGEDNFYHRWAVRQMKRIGGGRGKTF